MLSRIYPPPSLRNEFAHALRTLRREMATKRERELEAELQSLRELRDKDEAELKRIKTNTLDSMVDELLCPITQQLPVDPVMAEDGRVYDRKAIQEWIDKTKKLEKARTSTSVLWQRTSNEEKVFVARSPSTNEKMGLKLTEAVQVRNAIEHLVKSGTVEDEKAEAVKKRLATEKAANEGDVNAIWEMGDELYNKAVDMDEDCDREDAPHNQWFRRGAELHHPKCMAAYGDYLHRCADEQLGLFYLARAADTTDEAAYKIARLFLDRVLEVEAVSHKERMRFYDLPEESRMGWYRKRNLAQAKYWLTKAVSGECANKIMFESCLEEAKEKLQEIEEHEKKLANDKGEEV